MNKLALWIVVMVLISVTWFQAGASKLQKITPEEAKSNLDSGETILLLDVRTKEEFDSGHIPRAILFSLDRIKKEFEVAYPDKEQTIYVYCRSGRRSKTAAQTLAELGYNDVFDLGGIIDWPYEIETDMTQTQSQ